MVRVPRLSFIEVPLLATSRFAAEVSYVHQISTRSSSAETALNKAG
jgi:hypothetical protein